MKITQCLECGYSAYGKDETEAQFILEMHSAQMHTGENVTKPEYNRMWLE